MNEISVQSAGAIDQGGERQLCRLVEATPAQEVQSIGAAVERPDVLAAPMGSLLARMRAGELSPVDLVEEHIRRIEAVNPSLNSVVANRFEDARREAIDAEREYGSSAKSEYATSTQARPLLGVPFTVKEMIAVTGMPHTFGSLGRRGRRAGRDATVVARLRAAGAIPLGVTNVPEWGMWCESYNSVYGRTNNPFDPRRTPGGSSGGEGAAVGAGASVFGIGSDIGGSVRIPASFCGVFGHKPTTGLLPLTGHYPVYIDGPDAAMSKTAPYVSIGTLTRSAADIAPLMRAMAGRDGFDPNAEPLAFLSPDRVVWRGRRVMLLSNPLIKHAGPAEPDLTRACEGAGKLFEERGAIVQPAPERLLQHAGDVWFAALQTVGGPSFSELLGGGRRVHLEFEVLRTLIGVGRYSWPALFFCIGERFGRKKEQALRAAMRETRRLARKYRELLGEDGVLVSPAYPRSAPLHNKVVLRPFDFLYAAVFNVLRVPATSAPCGFDAHGLPMALQFTSNRGNDHVTIAAAAVVESSIGPWRPATLHG
jgi:fatty acid amide hydrolase 2